MARGSAQLSSEFGSAQLEARFGSVVRFSGAGSVQLEAELVSTRNLARRSSRFGSTKSGVTLARIRVEAWYSVQLCSKLGSASRLWDRLGVRHGVQLG